MSLTISHHLDDATLVAKAAGTLPGHLSIVVDAHLELCVTCRKGLRVAHEIGGALMADVTPSVEVSLSLKDLVLSKVGSATLHRLPVSKRGHKGEVPLTLQKFLGVENFDALAWRKSAPGIHVVKLPKRDADKGFFGLLKIAPGAVIPEHGHGGTELTLVLRGAYEDSLGRFGAGDIADHDEAIEHEPRVIGDEACICLVANQAALKFRAWPARILQRFIGI
jgi:putative transcriptional regulator